MRLSVEVRETEFTVYCEGIEVDTYDLVPEQGYITPCFTYAILVDRDRKVCVSYENAPQEFEAVLSPGESHECKHDAPCTDPTPAN